MIFTSKMAKERAQKHARSSEHSLQTEHLFFLNLADPSSILRSEEHNFSLCKCTAPRKSTRLVRVTHVRTHARDATIRGNATIRHPLSATHENSQTFWRLFVWPGCTLQQANSPSMMSGALCWSNIKLKNIIGNYELLHYLFHLILIKCFENNIEYYQKQLYKFKLIIKLAN